MNREKFFWSLFLSGLTCLLVFFTSLLSLDLYKYYHYKNEVVADHFTASVQELSSNRFSVKLDYFYEIGDKKYFQTGKLNEMIYKNSMLASDQVKALNGKKLKVYYHSTSPQKGITHKEFPYKRLFSTLVLFGLFLYFFLLGKFVLKRVV